MKRSESSTLTSSDPSCSSMVYCVYQWNEADLYSGLSFIWNYIIINVSFALWPYKWRINFCGRWVKASYSGHRCRS